MVYLKPRSRIEMIRQLKKLPSPKAIVFVGMHEESEPTARIIEHEVSGKQVHEHFGESVVFVKVPTRYTTRRVYDRLRGFLREYLEHLADGREKIAGVSQQAVSEVASDILGDSPKFMRVDHDSVKRIIFQQVARRSLPDEQALISEARRIHPGSAVLNVHCQTMLSADSKGWFFVPPYVATTSHYRQAIEANSESKNAFNVVEYEPGSGSDLLIELARPQNLLKPVVFHGGSTYDAIEGSAQRGTKYLHEIELDSTEGESFLEKNAGALKSFLERFLKHL